MNDGLGVFSMHGHPDCCVDMDSPVLKIGSRIKGTRLTPVRFSHTDKSGSFYFFRCVCGEIKLARKSLVKRTHTRSCGCLRKETSLKNLSNGVGCRFPEQNRSVENQFKKGDVPWNKGKKGIYKSSRKGKVMVRYPNGRIEWVGPLE